jgi:hypothetical protein
MESIEAQSLFKKKLGMLVNKQEVITLTEALEHMPLVVVQAASYIRQ